MPLYAKLFDGARDHTAQVTPKLLGVEPVDALSNCRQHILA